MFFDTQGLIDFCSRKKITIEQFTLLYLTHKEKYEQIYQYSEQVRPFPLALINDLVERKFVVNLGNKDEIYPDKLEIQDKFKKDLCEFLNDESDELFDTFPGRIVSGSSSFIGKTISPEELQLVYRRKLARTKSTHAQVMEALKEQIEHNTVGMGLKKWFETEQWLRVDNTIMDVTDDI